MTNTYSVGYRYFVLSVLLVASVFSFIDRQLMTILLEPIMTLNMTVPDDAAGEIMGDVNGRRGRIQGMIPQGDGTTVIEAEVPQAEVLQYATDLRSQTQGQGTFTMTVARLEPVPDHLASRIVEVQEKEAVAV